MKPAFVIRPITRRSGRLACVRAGAMRFAPNQGGSFAHTGGQAHGQPSGQPLDWASLELNSYQNTIIPGEGAV